MRYEHRKQVSALTMGLSMLFLQNFYIFFVFFMQGRVKRFAARGAPWGELVFERNCTKSVIWMLSALKIDLSFRDGSGLRRAWHAPQSPQAPAGPS